MWTPVLLLAGFGLVSLIWYESRTAAETAAHYGRQACLTAGVQWLDQSVMLTKLALRRATDGRLRVFRQYRFEYSRHGDDRQPGSLALLGRELQWISAPQREVLEASGPLP